MYLRRPLGTLFLLNIGGLKMRKMFILVTIFVSLGLLVGCGSNGQYEVKEGNTLTVGLEATYAPYNWTTQTQNDFTVSLSGQPGAYVDGYDVVIARKVAEDLGLKLVIKAIVWEGLIQALLANQIDVIIAGMSPTADRAKTVNFSSEYYRSEHVLVVKKGSVLADATSLNDFSGTKAVAQLGTLQDGLISQIPNATHMTALESYGAITQALRSGQADVFIAELPVAMSITNSNDDLSYVQLPSGSGFIVPDEDTLTAVALRKNDLDLLEAINNVLESITVAERVAWMTAAQGRQVSND